MKGNSLEKIKKRREDLVELFDRAPIKHAFGMELHYDDEGSAVFDMPYNPAFDHFLGGIHGGIMATLLDNAGWFTVAPLFDYWVATAEFQVRLLEHASQTALRSRGRIIRAGNKIVTAEMEVRTSDDVLASVGSGTFIATSIPADKEHVLKIVGDNTQVSISS